MIPVSLSTIQAIAHFLLISDVILVVYLFLNIIGDLIRKVFLIIFSTIVIMMVVYVVQAYANNQQSQMWSSVNEFFNIYWKSLENLFSSKAN
jgi:hypothetical protein